MDTQTGHQGIVFACIAPHGDLAIPEACRPGQRSLAAVTQAAMAELGRRFDEADPAIGERWTPEVLSYEAPTYYGMLCAAFTPGPA